MGAAEVGRILREVVKRRYYERTGGKKKIVLKQTDCAGIGHAGAFPCYIGDTKFKIRANFEVLLGTILTKTSDVIKDWSAELDNPIVPAGTETERKVTVKAWNTQIWKAPTVPGGVEVLVGDVAITAIPN